MGLFDEDFEGTSVSFWDKSGILAHKIKRIANKRNEKPSELLRTLVVDNIDDYEDVSDEFHEWLEIKREELNEQYARDIAKHRKKKGTFLNYVCSQIFEIKQKGGTDEQVRRYIQAQEPLFDNRDMSDRFQHMRDNPAKYYGAYKVYALNDGLEQFNPPELEGEQSK